MEYEMKEKIAERAYDEAGKGDYPDPFTWAVFRDKEHGIPKMFMICFVFLGAIVTVATKPKQICSGRSGETVKYSDFDGISFLLAMFFVLFFHEIIMLTLNFTIGLNRLTKLGCTAQHNDGTIVYSLCSWWAIVRGWKSILQVFLLSTGCAAQFDYCVFVEMHFSNMFVIYYACTARFNFSF
eukprot:m.163427 g.163427  ORF g.163427 m.163427 type:complete len:182 (-) comp18101_c0_seq14:796-1341(-)